MVAAPEFLEMVDQRTLTPSRLLGECDRDIEIALPQAGEYLLHPGEELFLFSNRLGRRRRHGWQYQRSKSQPLGLASFSYRTRPRRRGDAAVQGAGGLDPALVARESNRHLGEPTPKKPTRIQLALLDPLRRDGAAATRDRPFTTIAAVTVLLASVTTSRVLARASTEMASDASAAANSRCRSTSAEGGAHWLTLGSIAVDTLCGACSTSAAGRLNGRERSGLVSERRVPA